MIVILLIKISTVQFFLLANLSPSSCIVNRLVLSDCEILLTICLSHCCSYIESSPEENAVATDMAADVEEKRLDPDSLAVNSSLRKYPYIICSTSVLFSPWIDACHAQLFPPQKVIHYMPAFRHYISLIVRYRKEVPFLQFTILILEMPGKRLNKVL